MSTSIEEIKNELDILKKDVAELKHIVGKELSDEAKHALAEARKTPLSEYIDLK